MNVEVGCVPEPGRNQLNGADLALVQEYSRGLTKHTRSAAALPILDTPQIREAISHGLGATRSALAHGLDTACCGSMGRVETLMAAARELGDPAYLQDARALASTVLRRSRQYGDYALGWKKAPYVASFHQGMAGIGYEFLRLSAPASAPSLLLWE